MNDIAALMLSQSGPFRRKRPITRLRPFRQFMVSAGSRKLPCPENNVGKKHLVTENGKIEDNTETYRTTCKRVFLLFSHCANRREPKLGTYQCIYRVYHCAPTRAVQLRKPGMLGRKDRAAKAFTLTRLSPTCVTPCEGNLSFSESPVYKRAHANSGSTKGARPAIGACVTKRLSRHRVPPWWKEYSATYDDTSKE